jgi:hypothetical protein
MKSVVLTVRNGPSATPDSPEGLNQRGRLVKRRASSRLENAIHMPLARRYQFRSRVI